MCTELLKRELWVGEKAPFGDTEIHQLLQMASELLNELSFSQNNALCFLFLDQCMLFSRRIHGVEVDDIRLLLFAEALQQLTRIPVNQLQARTHPATDFFIGGRSPKGIL